MNTHHVFNLRQLTVVQQFKIDWGEPFASILVALEVTKGEPETLIAKGSSSKPSSWGSI